LERSVSDTAVHTESAVRARYAKAAQGTQQNLCCAVPYDSRYLKAIPAEVIERDYGCGDPSRYLRPGETVLDLGSGTGKICFIAAQVVGPEGSVIGVDMTDEMLAVARNAAPVVAEHRLRERKFRRDASGLLDLRRSTASSRRINQDANSCLEAEGLAADLGARGAAGRQRQRRHHRLELRTQPRRLRGRAAFERSCARTAGGQ
jgi:SAM-dependent methyltransferase